MKRADQVLAAGVIDAGLAAHGRVDLGQQRRRHLHEVDAALVAGGREPGHVADHAAAERDHAGIAVQAGLDQRVEHALEHGQGLVLLAIGQFDRAHALAGEAREQARGVQRTDRFVRDDEDVARRDVTGDQVRVVEQACADHDRVAASAQVDLQRLRRAARHGSSPSTPSWRQIWSTTVFTLRPSVSTTISATSV